MGIKFLGDEAVDLLCEAEGWTKKIKSKLSPSILQRVFKDGESITYNQLFSIFGQRRHERIIHEFLANLIESEWLQPVGKNLIEWFYGESSLSFKRGDIYNVESEVNKQKARFDILLSAIPSGRQLAIEIKVDHILTEKQEAAYQNWQNCKKNSRAVIVIGPNKLFSSDRKIHLLHWNILAKKLIEILNESRGNSKFLKCNDNWNFFNNFVNGLGQL